MCVPLEGALAFGAMGILPGAPAADLTVTPPSSTAAALSEHSRNNGRFFIIELLRLLTRWSAVLTCQDVSCSGDFLVNSAHKTNGGQMS